MYKNLFKKLEIKEVDIKLFLEYECVFPHIESRGTIYQFSDLYQFFLFLEFETITNSICIPLASRQEVILSVIFNMNKYLLN